MHEWTEGMEKEYQKKLENFPAPIGKFDPEKFAAREAAIKKWYATLTPAERLRHNIEKPGVIV